MYNGKSVSFFMGANTAKGFCSLFDGLYRANDGWIAYIIKGGPGTGKSTLMKKIAAEADRRGCFCERIYCSSDPRSLDAVIIPGLKIAVADGTPPHTIEPKYPGACERFVDLGAFRDDDVLRENAGAVIKNTDINSSEHGKCIGFLDAAKSVKDDMDRVVYSALRVDKLRRFAHKLSQTSFGPISDTRGYECKRFLSALTPEGEVIFESSFNTLCEKRIVLEDNFGVASSMLLKMLKDALLECGHDCITCCCPTDVSRTEHIMIPSLSMGFFTSCSYHPYSGTPDRVINCMRFYDSEIMKRNKNRLTFDRRARDELLDEAMNKLRSAKTVHDELERYYIAVMDRGGIEKESERLIEEIFNSKN